MPDSPITFRRLHLRKSWGFVRGHAEIYIEVSGIHSVLGAGENLQGSVQN